MHELGIVFHIASTVEGIAEQNHVRHISKTVVEIGEVSTIIPDYLTDCWNWRAKKSEILKDCELEIEMIPAVTYCEDCGHTYETVTYGKTCPNCGSGHTYLIQGNEHNIKEIVVDEEGPEEGIEVEVSGYHPSEPGADGMYVSSEN